MVGIFTLENKGRNNARHGPRYLARSKAISSAIHRKSKPGLDLKFPISGLIWEICPFQPVRPAFKCVPKPKPYRFIKDRPKGE